LDGKKFKQKSNTSLNTSPITMTNKKLILIATSALIAFGTPTHAQDILVVSPEFKKNANYEFNNEWHYLTSEMYLFNGTRFQSIIGDLYAGIPKKKRNDYPNPENILITATIDGTALGNLSYPIFNFNVTNTDGQLKTHTADSYEAIRIMDNLPLSSLGNGKIDCKINIDLVTRENPNKIFNFVAAQLKSISSFSTPLSAAKTLVGELGALLTSKTSNEEYKFNSTIRLYEDEDFSKKVSSVSVYTFKPSQGADAAIDSSDISKYIDSNTNPKIDRKSLGQLIKCTQYPYMVIVNYKSKYTSEPVIGDETTSETVEARLSKVKKAYDNGLLSAEIYTQELKLIEYLKEFVNLKTSINSYMLNTKNRITDDFRTQHLMIFINYLNLKQMLEARTKEFAKNAIFKNEFLPTYQTIITNADGYMEGDNSLKNIKNIAHSMREYYALDPKQRNYTAEINEKTLAILHSIDFPPNTENVQPLNDLYAMIREIEQNQNNKVFKAKTNKLKSMTPSAEASAYCENLKTEVNATYCQKCSEEANSVIYDYMQRLEAENQRLARKKLLDAIENARTQIFVILQKEKNIKQHFDNDFPNGLPDDAAFVNEDFLKLQQSRENLQNIIKKDYTDQNTTQLNIIADDIGYETQDLAKNLERICKLMPQLCND